jgi:hypothetical protein
MNARVKTGLVAAALVAVVFGGSGCNWVKEKIGIGRVVKAPEQESPDWVVEQVLKAAAIEPFDAAFAEYVKWIHSDEKSSPQAMKEWETMRFKALRNKFQCFMRPEEGSPTAFKVMETRENAEDYFTIFVQCKTSDTPTPCHLKKDPSAGGKWRVKYNCLN